MQCLATIYDAVIVGLGPAGIMAAHELNKARRPTLLIDNKAHIGGVAFQTDVNMQNIDGFPPQSDFGERTLGSKDAADRLVREAYAVMRSYGLPEKPYDPTDIYSYAVNEPTLKRIINRFEETVFSSDKLDLSLRTTMQQILPGISLRWRIFIKREENELIEIETNNIIIATGKLSVNWLVDFLDAMQINYNNNPSLSIGFRLEGLADKLNPISEGRENPKIRISVDGIISETFCWCKNGGVIAYEFANGKLLDGEHCYGRPTLNTSFGVITNVELPPGTSNTTASISFFNYINTLGQGSILLQRFGDFLEHRETCIEDMESNSVKPSLGGVRLCNLRSFFPSVVVDGFLELTHDINSRFDNAIDPDTLVYAPILERVYPEILLSDALETNRPGLFMAGDCSGRGVGVAPAFVMGLVAAREIAARVG